MRRGSVILAAALAFLSAKVARHSARLAVRAAAFVRATILGRAAVHCVVAIASLGASVMALDRILPPDLSRLSVVGSDMVDRSGRTLALMPAPGGVWRFRAGVEDVAPVLIETLVRIEDRHFWYHPGIDPFALARAAFQDVRAGKIVSGGSTITMQVARLLTPRPRTWRAKLVEIARAFQLEARFSKREILGIWLTLAPLGGNLEGVRAGSLAWFGIAPRSLEPAQAALLVAIPRRPEALRPDRHAARARALRDRILGVAADRDPGDVPTRRIALPRHAAVQMAALARAPRVATTLDLPLQVALERLATTRIQTLPDRASLAIVIADAPSREIRAIVSGAAGAPEDDRASFLDLTRAVRSPGSAMKPFIYAMAFADGLAAPETLLPDLPRRFGGYAPENFDRDFSGSVSAAEALRRSLNLPAVALLDRVGPLRFAASLRAAGVSLKLPRGADPSLPLALGGAGVTLRQLTGLYAALATDGDAGALLLLAGQTAARARLLTARSAASVASVLTRPFPDRLASGVAWKTGTSWGGRDAWALGFDARAVAGVWIGRPDGTPMPGTTGRNLALPLLARVFDLLAPAPRPTPPEPGRAATAAASSDALHLLFPPPDSVLSGDAGPIVVRAMGGRRPLTFLVDGVPLAANPARREVGWLPTGPGFYRLTIVDADGATARAGVRVR